MKVDLLNSISSTAKRPMNGTDGNRRSDSFMVSSKYDRLFNFARVVGSVLSVPKTSTISLKHFSCTSGFFAMLYKQNVMPDVVVS